MSLISGNNVRKVSKTLLPVCEGSRPGQILLITSFLLYFCLSISLVQRSPAWVCPTPLYNPEGWPGPVCLDSRTRFLRRVVSLSSPDNVDNQYIDVLVTSLFAKSANGQFPREQ